MKDCIAVILAVVILAFGANAAQAATSCSGQYGTCFSMCQKYGYGRHRPPAIRSGLPRPLHRLEINLPANRLLERRFDQAVRFGQALAALA